jgi:hypothetical protein
MLKPDIKNLIKEEIKEQLPNAKGITVITPNTTELKMKAIYNCSQALLELTKAISSVSLEIKLNDVCINNCHTGVHFDSK